MTTKKTITIASAEDLHWAPDEPGAFDINEIVRGDTGGLPSAWWSAPGKVVHIATGTVVAEAIAGGVISVLSSADSADAAGNARNSQVWAIEVMSGDMEHALIDDITPTPGLVFLDEDGDEVDIDGYVSEMSDYADIGDALGGDGDADDIERAFLEELIVDGDFTVYAKDGDGRCDGRPPRIVVYRDDDGDVAWAPLDGARFDTERFGAARAFWMTRVAENLEGGKAFDRWIEGEAEGVEDTVRSALEAAVSAAGLDAGDDDYDFDIDDHVEIGVAGDADRLAISVRPSPDFADRLDAEGVDIVALLQGADCGNPWTSGYTAEDNGEYTAEIDIAA